MKKILSFVLLCATILLASCSKDDEQATMATSVSLDKTTLSLLKGATTTLTATIAPDDAGKEVTWMSCNESVATVNGEGVVTAVAVGKATITVVTRNGGKSASCEVTVTTPLAMGDFYLNDGTIISKDATLTAEQKTKCIGIVFKVGKDADGDWKDDCVYMQKDGTTPMTEVKGYVLALYDAEEDACAWGSKGTKVGIVTKNDEFIGFYGYKDTQMIIKYALDNNKTLETDFPAAYCATKAYETTHPAPAASSGWFLPSVGQSAYWITNQEEFLKSAKKATTDAYQWKDSYWSSSEYWYEPGNTAYAFFINKERMEGTNKTGECPVRPLLAI